MVRPFIFAPDPEDVVAGDGEDGLHTILKFEARDHHVTSGSWAFRSWETHDATEVEISGLGSVGLVGEDNVGPLTTKT